MKTHKVQQLKDRTKRMDRAAKNAVEWLELNPNPHYTHSVLNVFRTWNQEQERFWADVFNNLRQQETINAMKEEHQKEGAVDEPETV